MTILEGKKTNKKSSDEITRIWPEFPKDFIEKKMKFASGQVVYYSLAKIGTHRIVPITNAEIQGLKAYTRPWPDFPQEEMEKYLQIKAGDEITYENLGGAPFPRSLCVYYFP